MKTFIVTKLLFQLYSVITYMFIYSNKVDTYVILFQDVNKRWLKSILTYIEC